MVRIFEPANLYQIVILGNMYQTGGLRHFQLNQWSEFWGVLYLQRRCGAIRFIHATFTLKPTLICFSNRKAFTCTARKGSVSLGCECGRFGAKGNRHVTFTLTLKPTLICFSNLKAFTCTARKGSVSLGCGCVGGGKGQAIKEFTWFNVPKWKLVSLCFPNF